MEMSCLHGALLAVDTGAVFQAAVLLLAALLVFSFRKAYLSFASDLSPSWFPRWIHVVLVALLVAVFAGLGLVALVGGIASGS
jgi:hypothetical protein